MRHLIALVLVLLAVRPLGADVTLTQTMTVEGGMGSLMGGMTAQMVMRVKGTKSRMDVDTMGRTFSAVTDVSAGRVIVLDHAARTVQVVDLRSSSAPALPIAAEAIEATFEPTGQSRVIDGVSCDEYAYSISMGMADMGGTPQLPPEAAAMMKDVRVMMSGSIWIATAGPGVADYVAFQKAAADSNMLATLTGLSHGQRGSGLERLLAAAATAQGLPYQADMTMSLQGSGELAELMKQMSPMTMSQRTTAVSTDPIHDDLFEAPADYTVVKR